ncbi:copper chaperone [Candidatus Woesearchaeota archaeon]|nr:MAG: copper chaperone [Candidatus Woesearchaeota archaeon]
MKEENIKVSGMHCQSCAMLIKDELNDMGVEVSFSGDTAHVKFDESKITLDKIKEAINKLGYRT